MNSVMNIGLNITKYFMRYAYVLIKSIFENNMDSEVHIYIISSEIEEADLDLFNMLADKYSAYVHLIKVDIREIKEKFVSALSIHPLAMHTHYFQIMRLPDSVERIIIMDSDMVVRKSLKDFYEMDFEGNYVICTDGSCVNDRIQEWHSTFERMDCTRFSSVCALYDVKKIKADFTQEDIWNADKEVCRIWGRSNEEWGYALLFNGKEKYVPETKYGFYISEENEQKFSVDELKNFSKDAVVIHYFMSKPWEVKNGMTPLHQYWWDYAVDTPFYEELNNEFWTNWSNYRRNRRKLMADSNVSNAIRDSFLENFKYTFRSYKDRRIVLYGAGYKARVLIESLDEYQFTGILDSDKSKIGKEVGGMRVVTPDELPEDMDMIIITTNIKYWEEIVEEIRASKILSRYPIYYLNGTSAEL